MHLCSNVVLCRTTLKLEGNILVLLQRHCSDTQECATTACGDDNVPTCPKCGSPLRTETVLFEQAMPEGAVERAQCTIQESDLLIVIGSTLSPGRAWNTQSMWSTVF